MTESESTRIDKWLWAVRIFKTRALATEACRNGHVRIAGVKVKPSRNIAIGEIIEADKEKMKMLMRVLAPVEKRIGAKLVKDYMEDLTPPEEIERAKRERAEHRLNRVVNHGEGRPTKLQRRKMDTFLEQIQKTK